MGNRQCPLRDREGGDDDRAGFEEAAGDVVARWRPGDDEGDCKGLARMEEGGVSVSKSTKLLCIFVVLLSGLLLNWVIMH